MLVCQHNQQKTDITHCFAYSIVCGKGEIDKLIEIIVDVYDTLHYSHFGKPKTFDDEQEPVARTTSEVILVLKEDKDTRVTQTDNSW